MISLKTRGQILSSPTVMPSHLITIVRSEFSPKPLFHLNSYIFLPKKKKLCLTYQCSSLLKGKYRYLKYLNCIYSCTTPMSHTCKISLVLYKPGLTCTTCLKTFLKIKKDQTSLHIFFVKFTHKIHGNVTCNIIPPSRRYHLHTVLLVISIVGLPTAPLVEGLHGRSVRIDKISLFL